uniref:Putative secreted protein n=1 Tax=Anopheles darlingi TaxID=43151 RepID=A0A2M4DPQ6_ANODA
MRERVSFRMPSLSLSIALSHSRSLSFSIYKRPSSFAFLVEYFYTLQLNNNTLKHIPKAHSTHYHHHHW